MITTLKDPGVLDLSLLIQRMQWTERALYKTFHELNGKMVEVKRAVFLKEMSPWSNRSPLGSYSPGLSRVSSFLNKGGYASSPVGNYGGRVDGRLSPG
ncbi:hypothetical protein MLD38_036755 [Melastoma candidum]|uniref:Uncharacterized protein n=1 Tax=Melastoma candidum TaxID=119954 RepID=A0ACB9LKM5_9MYRT|nr:hypothetical protein MLD38_036755 [Melastoma candidum]